MEKDVEGTVDDIPDWATETFTETKMQGDKEHPINNTGVQTWFNKVDPFLLHVKTISKGLVDKCSNTLFLLIR